MTPVNAIPIITAVMVLHNIGVDMGDIIPPPRPNDIVQDDLPPDPNIEDLPGGLAMRLAMVAEFCMFR